MPSTRAERLIIELKGGRKRMGHCISTKVLSFAGNPDKQLVVKLFAPVEVDVGHFACALRLRLKPECLLELRKISINIS